MKRPFRNLSIKTKVSLFIIVASLSLTTAVPVVLGFYGYYSHRHRDVEDVDNLASVIKTPDHFEHLFGKQGSGDEFLTSLASQHQDLVAVCVYGEKGEVLASYRRKDSTAGSICPAPAEDRTDVSAFYISMFQGVLLKGKRAGTIFMQSDMTRLRSGMAWNFAMLCCLLAGGVLLGYFLSVFCQKEFFDPFNALVVAAKSVALDQDYSARVVKDRGGEIGLLVDAFNNMLVQIEQRDAELQKSRSELEIRVEERTRNLKNEIDNHKRTEKSLRDSQELTRLLLDSTAEAIYGLDLQGDCTLCNAACVKLLGYERPGDLIGENAHYLFHHTSSDGSPISLEQCNILQACRNGESSHGTDEILWRADGTSFPVEHWSYPIRRDGQVVGVVVTFFDISERRHLEAQYRASQRLEAVGLLAGGIAHDFNNLLGVIIGYCELLETEIDSSSALGKPIEEIKRAGTRAASLTRQLLAFSRKQVLEPEIVDLNLVILRTQELLHRLIREDVRIEFKLDLGLGKVKLDTAQFEQVIMNLAVNSRDAMPTGGELTVETENIDVAESSSTRSAPTIRPGRYVVVTVRDTGIGMDAKTQLRIFEPFFTTKEVDKGTGLGLSTVYGIVKQSGGEIEVTSEIGKGATFKVYFPRIADFDVPTAIVKRDSKVAIRARTILLVEDEESVRNLVRMLLERTGYSVLVAVNGLEAMHVAETFTGSIDLVLTDARMPQMNGLELIQRIHVIRPKTKAICMTGYSEETIGEADVLTKQTTIIAKPFTRVELISVIEEVLGPASRSVGAE